MLDVPASRKKVEAGQADRRKKIREEGRGRDIDREEKR